ncbi:stage IV sporulation protein FB [Virgibacillus dakarensis]|uniref:site-2 protease family protein n=1 Tax=Virgibacillus dakarensis TaxID=1917889 RepID=UPI000B441E34|nr:site-2 protease family protein [Virgibacillus dakarensis]MTW84199.1 stage IV sporulation protein FB [Virgibacillus dakarensis]
MTVHKYLPAVHIHPILLVFIAISFFTGTFVELFVILSIVLLHEFGHYTMALLYKWRIRSIMLWIFGGVMDTDEHGNRPLREEMLVTIAGPFQNIILYGIIFVVSAGEVLPPSIITMLLHYNTLILLFNLLPIWPLDGGKFLFLLLSSLLPYQKAYHSVIIVSLLACTSLLLLQLFVFPFTLSSFLLILFLLKENRMDWKQRYYVFMRFLLNRYQGSAPVKGIRSIVVPYDCTLMDVFAHFHREKRHSIYIQFPENQRKLIEENDCLQRFFYDKQYNKPIGEIARYS